MDTVRIARELGGVSQLLPDDCDGLADAPFNLVDAISTALGFLSFEEFPREERPPRRIWFDPEAMESHWQQVKAKWAGKGDGPSAGPAQENLAARDLIVYG